MIDIMREKVSDEVDGYLKAAINLIIDQGYANPSTYDLRYQIENDTTWTPGVWSNGWEETNYYGSRAAVSYTLTKAALQDIIENGLDYNSCTDPAEHTGQGFANTFTDSHEEFTYLRCLLKTNSNNIYVYTMNCCSYYNSKIKGLADLIISLGDYKDFDVKYVAQNRLDNLVDEYGGPVNWEWVKEYGK